MKDLTVGDLIDTLNHLVRLREISRTDTVLAVNFTRRSPESCLYFTIEEPYVLPSDDDGDSLVIPFHPKGDPP